MDEINETVETFLACLDEYCEKLTEYIERIKNLTNKEDEK